MKVFKIGLSLIFYKKTWVIALLAMIVIPMLFPYLTPYEFNYGVIQPARAQAAWAIAFILAIVWGLLISANLGEYIKRSQLADFLYAMGMKKAGVFFQSFLVSSVFIIPLVVFAALICLLFCTPAHEIEAAEWRDLIFQSSVSTVLIFLPLSALAISLANRFTSVIGYVITVFLAIYGLYGVAYMEQLLESKQIILLDFVWQVSPHYYVGDLTTRFVYKMGALTSKAFNELLIYLGITGVTIVLLAYILFKGVHRGSFFNAVKSAKFAVLSLIALTIASQLSVPQESAKEANPLALFGSAYGKTIAMALQSPIEMIWHEGANHHGSRPEGEEEEEGGHMHVVEKEKEYTDDFKGYIAKLEDNRKRRTNPYANGSLHKAFLRSAVERKIRFAWKMDPANLDNYMNYHFFLTVSDVEARKVSPIKALKIAEETLNLSKNFPNDPQAMLVAANSAQNVIAVYLSSKNTFTTVPDLKPWFEVSERFLAYSNIILNQPDGVGVFPYPPEHKQWFHDNLFRLNGMQAGLQKKFAKNANL